MKSTVTYHRGWIISCHASALKTQGTKSQFEATATLEKSSEPSIDPVKAVQEENLRRAYGVRGPFASEDLAKDAAIRAAKRSIDLLYV